MSIEYQLDYLFTLLLSLFSFYLGGLLEGAAMQKNKTSINKEYELIYYESGDFDERLFIDQMDQIGIVSLAALYIPSYISSSSSSSSIIY